ncbi:uncharacterized protein THITE_2108076 [Thermothielavioides terrestris NRRL 8126]|uniref:Zn(2)-C6 fungal-type domain-containing protein n=1 Tax=Thermothielavioides terrestris (strain ATCC 38088 / NRRL 8126) TaxID=578455 RepID=G2QXF0_THETT|nr:uncharacterized protein THITE_2108076 [Thermothielavioides terrestris NRRL 8126]AEO63173.1 hypothetical protein THITE_2108076 [Thermothielavioides terrestris NRRL 8126]
MDQIAPGYLAYQAPSSIPSGCPGPHDQLPATTWPCSASLPTPPLLSTSNPAVQNLTCHGDECFSSLVGLPSRGNGQLEGRGSCYPPIQEASVNAVAPASDQIEDYFATDVAVLNEHYMPGEVQHSVQDDSRVAVSLEVSVAVEPKPADEPHSELMKSRKKRARFDEGLRTETSNTRIMGACLRCRNQRIRCVPNKNDSKSPLAPCETCLKVRRDSKKTIHNIPCLRVKVTSMEIYRRGGLGLTKRFDHTNVLDVSDHVDDVVYDIEIAQGICPHPLRLRVRRFRPQPTDITYRRYMDDGVPKKQHIPAFCLADVKRTAREFSEYIDRYALTGLSEAARDSDDLIRETFLMLMEHYNSLSVRLMRILGFAHLLRVLQ